MEGSLRAVAARAWYLKRRQLKRSWKRSSSALLKEEEGAAEVEEEEEEEWRFLCARRGGPRLRCCLV